MIWSKGYTSRYYARIVDRQTWADTEKLDIVSGSVSRTVDGLMESANLSCRSYSHPGEQWIRIYLDAVQDGAAEHIPVFTGLAISTETQINGAVKETPLECYSVLKPAEDILLDKGWYAPAKTDGAVVIKDLLSVLSAPVEIEGAAPDLTEHIIAEGNESRLSMAHKVLAAINWRLRISGDGRVAICPLASEPSMRFDALDNDSIEPQVNIKNDWFECPNVYRATADDTTAVYRDDDPDSLLSTVGRGREVWAADESVSLNSGESVYDYARRMLKKLQAVGTEVSYSRRFFPNVTVGDIVSLHYPAQGIDGTYRITSQSMTLSHGGTTAEEVEKA